MTSYQAPLRDYAFLLNAVHQFDAIAETETFADATPDLVAAVLEQAASFAEDVLVPLNPPSVDAPATFNAGEVKSPAGFPAAFKAYAEGGWLGLAALPEHGGQGLPHTLHVLVDEIVSSANLGFSMYRGLVDGAYNAIRIHGSADLQERYLPALVSGEILPTMNLTEPHCGSDLGMLRTRAEPEADGTFRITGSKIFITGGEQDITHNIIHLVLARLPDAPEGGRGISLFLVPKYWPGDNGAEERNSVFCTGIEHKMGLKGSATCAMSYEGARGWLIGKPNGGLAAMFTMMNSARLSVGVQGICGSEAAYQIAARYAAERRQGVAPGADPTAGPVTIDQHPDVQRMLRAQRAFTEAGRSLAVEMGLAIDGSHAFADPAARESSDDIAQLLTPIVKSFLTDGGFESANLAMQVLGGHGYIAEWGVERWVRDLRISPIYEGTNGIQALDLVGRKLGMKNGQLFERYFDLLESAFARTPISVDDEGRGLAALAVLRDVTARMKLADAQLRATNASDFLRLFGTVALAGQWARMARAAQDLIDQDRAFYEDKIETARFYFDRVLPQVHSLAHVVIHSIQFDRGVA